MKRRAFARALVPVLDAELTQETGLSIGWYDVLLELSAAPDRRMRMSDLGNAAVLSRTRVSRVVDELATELQLSPNELSLISDWCNGRPGRDSPTTPSRIVSPCSET